MSEDTNTQETSQPEFTEVEIKAMEKGWRPEKDSLDGKEWVPADEFLRREPIFEKMRVLKNKVSSMERDMQVVSEHLTKVRQTEYERARADLLREKKEALTEGDADRVIQIDEKIEELRENKSQPAPQNNQVQQIFDTWAEQNNWFFQNKEMQTYAEGYGVQLKKDEPNLTYDQFLNKVANKTKEFFKERAQRTSSAVDQGTTDGRSQATRTTNNKSKLRESDLSEKELSIMKTILRTTKLTKDQYLEQYAEALEREKRRGW